MSAPRDGDRWPWVGRLPRRLPVLLWLVWLAFLETPIDSLLRAHLSQARVVSALCGLAIFVAVYVWAAFDNPISSATSRLGAPGAAFRAWLPVLVLACLSVAFNVGYGSVWLGLFIYTSASVGPRLPAAPAAGLVAALTLVTGITGAALQAGGDNTAQACLLVGGIGISVVSLAHAMQTVSELRAARAEIARLAVSEERLRFARDLHDLLGHSLSLIALKCDLAKQLVAGAPERAAKEIEDVEAVARSALHEVREAVAGYRQTSLASEVAGGREILAAAGIGFSYEGTAIALPPGTEAVLSWTVREGITNVIRHGRARRCSIRLMHDGERVGIEVTNDGQAAPVNPNSAPSKPNPAGSGIAGLAERAAALGGRCEAGPQPAGGFRLAVSLPIGGDGRDERTGQESAVPVNAGGRA